MIETVLALSLFGHFAWFAIIITAWIIGLFFAEKEEEGWLATIFTVIVLGTFQFEGTYQLASYFSWMVLGIYLGAGFVFSLVRTFLFARKEQTKFLKREAKIAKQKAENPNAWSSNYEKKSIVGHVFRWWFLWPVSFIAWIFTDLVKDLYDFVWRYLKGFYYGIVKFAEGTVTISEDEQD